MADVDADKGERGDADVGAADVEASAGDFAGPDTRGGGSVGSADRDFGERGFSGLGADDFGAALAGEPTSFAGTGQSSWGVSGPAVGGFGATNPGFQDTPAAVVPGFYDLNNPNTRLTPEQIVGLGVIPGGYGYSLNDRAASARAAVGGRTQNGLMDIIAGNASPFGLAGPVGIARGLAKGLNAIGLNEPATGFPGGAPVGGDRGLSPGLPGATMTAEAAKPNAPAGGLSEPARRALQMRVSLLAKQRYGKPWSALSMSEKKTLAAEVEV